jgi:hypothetical protein
MTASKKRWTNRTFEISAATAAPPVTRANPQAAKTMPASVRVAGPIDPPGGHFTQRSIIVAYLIRAP